MKPARWHQIEPLYFRALEIEESRRPAFLQEACAGDDDLRQEIEGLLAEGPSAASFLEKPALHEIAADFVSAASSWVGRQIGNYRFISLAGAGGMGEVYRAHDLNLKRDVAIKILPDEFSGNSDRISRFQREAEVLASLSHTNIAAIYDLQEADGCRFLIMEFVEGETLADRIAKGPLSANAALSIARQICEAFEAAHEKGIVHRDLKPANISLTRDGTVKVLDFGLAKVCAIERAGPTGSDAPTVMSTSSPGLILGTMAYMSPEQARGETVDARTDLWSLGVVIYEMMTGVKPFDGATAPVFFEALIGRQPMAMRKRNPKVPLEVERIVGRLLEKERGTRYQSAAEVRVDLTRLERDIDSGGVAAVMPAQKWSLTHFAAGLTLVALLILAGWLSRPTKSSAPVTSLSEYTQLTNFIDSATAPSLSPDGRMLAFKRGVDAFLSTGQIYIKLLPNGESVQLTRGSELKYAPVFTPDGSSIAYTNVSAAGWDTWIVPVLGSEPRPLLPNASGLTWITGQRILFSEVKTGLHMGIVTATQSRGERREIYFPPHEDAMAHYSYLSPDGRSILVVEMDQAHAFDQPCRLLPFDGSSAGRHVGPQGTCTAAAWSPDGKWMYFGARVRGSSHIWRQGFPDGALEQITFGPVEEEGIAMAPDGRSLVTSVGTRRSAIWIHDGTGDRAISSEGYATTPRLSRDGSRVFYLFVRELVLSALGWVASSGEMYSMDLASGKTASLLPGVSVADYDISPDEKEVAFTTTADGGESQIWLAPLDKRTPPFQIDRGGDSVSFGADGELVFRSLGDKENGLVRIKKDGSGRERIPVPPIQNKFGISPDGKWVVVFSQGSGKDAQKATLAVPVHGGTPKKISPAWPAGWSDDGRFFFVKIDASAPAAFKGKTLVIPVPFGKTFPDLPASGIDVSLNAVVPPGTQVIEHDFLSSGPDPSRYVFSKTDLQRNLFQIPLH